MSERATFQHLGIFSDLVDHVGIRLTGSISGRKSGSLYCAEIGHVSVAAGSAVETGGNLGRVRNRHADSARTDDQEHDDEPGGSTI